MSYIPPNLQPHSDTAWRLFQQLNESLNGQPKERKVTVITDNIMERLEAGQDGEKFWLTSIRRGADDDITDIIRSIILNLVKKEKVVAAWNGRRESIPYIGEWRE